MRTLAVLSQKGGTGKTTLAVHLAVAAWSGQKRVLIADLDPQRSASEWRRARQGAGPGLIDCKPGAVFIAQQAAQRADIGLMVLDTRPSADSDTAEAIRCADLCLVVLRPTFFDLKATTRLAEMTRAMNKTAFFVLNQAPPCRAGREAPVVIETAKALEALRLPLAPAGLRARIVYQSAVSRGLTAQEAEPSSPAAAEVDLLWRHIEPILFAARPPAARPGALPARPPKAAAVAQPKAANLTAAE